MALPNIAQFRAPFILPTVKESSRRAVAANLVRLSKRARRQLRERVRVHGNRTFQLARQRSPVDTGRMRAAHVLEFSPGGYAYTVGVDPEPFAAEGLAYYPFWVHEGRQGVPGRPWLRSAFLEQDRRFQREMAETMRRAMRRSSR